MKTVWQVLILVIGLNDYLVTSQSFCGQPLKERRIIGGEPAEKYQFPWQVAIYECYSYGGSCRFICGGTLLSSLSILTAGHCVETYKTAYIEFPNGSVEINKNTMKIPSAKVTKHPGYTIVDGSPVYDFAIITLSTPIEFTNGTLPICLPDPLKNYTNDNATIIGWGETELYSSVTPDLMMANCTVSSNKECQDMFDNYSGIGEFDIKPSDICCTAPVVTTCSGDSGGSLLALEEDGSFYTQIGITSYGHNLCPAGNPSVFARVTNQLYWIYTQVEGKFLPAPVSRSPQGLLYGI